MNHFKCCFVILFLCFGLLPLLQNAKANPVIHQTAIAENTASSQKIPIVVSKESVQEKQPINPKINRQIQKQEIVKFPQPFVSTEKLKQETKEIIPIDVKTSEKKVSIPKQKDQLKQIDQFQQQQILALKKENQVLKDNIEQLKKEKQKLMVKKTFEDVPSSTEQLKIYPQRVDFLRGVEERAAGMYNGYMKTASDEGNNVENGVAKGIRFKKPTREESFLIFISTSTAFLLLFWIWVFFHYKGSSISSVSSKEDILWEEEHSIPTQLNLARVYIDMNEKRLAQMTLNKVMKYGNEEQKSEAHALLEEM